MFKLSLNSGHLVGKDPGAVQNGLQEADIVETIQNECSRVLREQYSLDLEDKDELYTDDVATANAFGAHVALELHLNSASDSSANGFESFIYPGHSDSIKLQKALHPRMFNLMKKYGITSRDRGAKARNDLYFVKGTKMAALLVEFCFVSNPTEASAIKMNAKALGADLAHEIAAVCKLPKKSSGGVSTSQWVHLPKDNDSWRIYNVNGPYTTGNEIAMLRPAKFDGLDYKIERWITKDSVAVIKTEQFGEAAIYIASSTGARIYNK